MLNFIYELPTPHSGREDKDNSCWWNVVYLICRLIVMAQYSFPQHQRAWGNMVIHRGFLSAPKSHWEFSLSPSPSPQNSHLVLGKVVTFTLFPNLMPWVQLLGGKLIVDWSVCQHHRAQQCPGTSHTHTHPSGTTSRWNKLQNHLLSQVKGLFENLMKPMSFLSRIGGKNYSSDCIHHFRGCENFWNSQSGDSEPAASVFSGNLLEILHPQSLLNQKLCCGNKPSRYFWWIFKFGNTPEQWFSKLPPY